MSKGRIEDLALFGGKPAFSQQLHVGRPNIGDRDRLMGRIEQMLDRRWLTNNGPFVQELEHAVADQVGAAHCIAVCNATIGLEIAMRALGLTGEVIVPAFTFVATAHAAQWQGLSPTFADVDPETHTIDPEDIGRRITPRTSAIVGVHVWGTPCDIESIDEIARRHRLRVVYDAAHAFACSHGGRAVGTFGDVEVFSFHGTKFMNSFEGGAIVTNDAAIARTCRLMTNFGFLGLDNVGHVGTNGKMTEVCAAMGLTSLESLDEFIAANHANYNAYAEALAGLPGISLYQHDHSERRNYQYVVALVDPELAGIHRDTLLDALWAENVLVRRYFYPGVHRMEPYRSLRPNDVNLFPVTDQVSERVMVLPTGQTIGTEEIARIGDIIRLAAQNAPEVTARAAERRLVGAPSSPVPGAPSPGRVRRPLTL